MFYVVCTNKRFFKKRALKTEIKKEFTCEVRWGKKPNVETKHIFRSVLELDYLDVKMCFIWVSWTEGNLSCTFWINKWSLYSGVVWKWKNGERVDRHSPLAWEREMHFDGERPVIVADTQW